MRRGHERLDLDQQGTRPLHGHDDHRAGHTLTSVGEEDAGRVANFLEPGFGHFKDPDFMGGAEAVLGHAKYPIGVLPLAFKIDHGIDDVLQGFGTRKGSLLGYVTDKTCADPSLLAQGEEAARHLSDLANAARRRFERPRICRLDGIHDQQIRSETFPMVDDRLKQRLGTQIEVRRHRTDPLRTNPDLFGRLFSRHIEDRATLTGEAARHLKQEGRLADPRITTDEEDRARDHAAA